MVYIYVANISKLLDPLENPDIMNMLPQKRQEKILACKQKQKRLQSLGAGLLLDKVLCRYGILSDKVYEDKNGKPVVDGICFNLSHSGDLVICVVGEKSVGCDIEKMKDAPKRVVERSFTDEEKEYLQNFSGDAYNQEFFRIWTKKESYLKMTGQGIRIALDTLEIKNCYIQEYELPGYCITVCAEEQEFAELSWEYF